MHSSTFIFHSSTTNLSTWCQGLVVSYYVIVESVTYLTLRDTSEAAFLRKCQTYISKKGVEDRKVPFLSAVRWNVTLYCHWEGFRLES